uniref:Uncharacterized protein n=1 Tax=Arundo donax TaxID=35708 RepID=A0A0A8ZR24_ARUDO
MYRNVVHHSQFPSSFALVNSCNQRLNKPDKHYAACVVVTTIQRE